MLAALRKMVPFVVCLSFTLAGCSDDDSAPPDSAPELDGTLVPDAAPESDGTTIPDAAPELDGPLGPTDKGLLACDAIYIPVVRIQFEDPDGACVVAKASYKLVGSSTPSASVDCPCPADTSFGGVGCILDPPLGEQVEITATAEGFVSQTKTVEIPYVCVPNIQLKFGMAPVS